MKALRSFFTLLARLCLAGIFIFAGASKLVFFDQTALYMQSKNLPSVPLLLILAALTELIGGLSLILGYKTRFGSALLLLFLIPTTFIFHDFWNYSGEEQVLQQIMFLKNLAIFGGLLYLFFDGPGGLSFDACCRSKPSEHKE